MTTVNSSKFLEALISSLLEKKIEGILVDNLETNKKIMAVLDVLHTEAGIALGKDRGLAYEIFLVLDSISPNSNTGAFDGFWQVMRMLPIVHFQIRPSAFIFHQPAGKIVNLPDHWKEVVQKSVEVFAN